MARTPTNQAKTSPIAEKRQKTEEMELDARYAEAALRAFQAKTELSRLRAAAKVSGE